MVFEVPPGGGRGLWRFHNLLPPTEHRTTLREASTPLISCTDLAERLGVAKLLVKNEAVNPRLSFKDRAMALRVGLPRDVGVRGWSRHRRATLPYRSLPTPREHIWRLSASSHTTKDCCSSPRGCADRRRSDAHRELNDHLECPGRGTDHWARNRRTTPQKAGAS